MKTAERSGRVEIARGVKHQGRSKIVGIGAGNAEVAESLLGPGAARYRRKFEHGPMTEGAAVRSGSVKIARCIEDHSACGDLAIGTVGVETMQYCFSPVAPRPRRQFEYDAFAESSP